MTCLLVTREWLKEKNTDSQKQEKDFSSLKDNFLLTIHIFGFFPTRVFNIENVGKKMKKIEEKQKPSLFILFFWMFSHPIPTFGFGCFHIQFPRLALFL